MWAVPPQAPQPTGSSLEIPSRVLTWTVMSGDMAGAGPGRQAGETRGPGVQKLLILSPQAGKCCHLMSAARGGGSHLFLPYQIFGTPLSSPCEVERGTQSSAQARVSQAKPQAAPPKVPWASTCVGNPGKPTRPFLPPSAQACQSLDPQTCSFLGPSLSVLINSRVQTPSSFSTPTRPPSRPLAPSPSPYQAAQV